MCIPLTGNKKCRGKCFICPYILFMLSFLKYQVEAEAYAVL